MIATAANQLDTPFSASLGKLARWKPPFYCQFTLGKFCERISENLPRGKMMEQLDQAAQNALS